MNLKSKLPVFFLLGLGLLLFFGSKFYWSINCASIGCTNYEMSAILDPLKAIGTLLVVLSIPFFLTKSEIFSYWIKWFSVPIALSVVYFVSRTEVSPVEQFPVYRADVIEGLTWFWFVATLIFIGWRWYRTKK